MFAYLPAIVKTLLGVAVIYAGATPETFNIKNFAPTNVAAFLNPLETNKALFALAGWLDAVTIWCLILMGIGIATVAGVKRSSGYIAVFGWWAILMLIGLGWDAITKQFSNQEILLALILVAIVVIGIAVLVKMEKHRDTLGN
jgi:hypothetical protein